MESGIFWNMGKELSMNNGRLQTVASEINIRFQDVTLRNRERKADIYGSNMKPFQIIMFIF